MARVPELDGIRGLAILIVVVAHVILPGHMGGGVGVCLFFVLSGHLITGMLLREQAATGRVDLRAFWARRARRLGPALVPVVVLVVAVGVVSGHVGRGVQTIAMLPVADYYYATGGALTMLGQTWSLAVEEQFYLLWPMLLAVMVRDGRVRAWLVGAAVVLAGWRLAAAAIGLGEWAYFSLDGNAYALVVGAVSATTSRVPPRWMTAAGLAVLLCAAVAPLSWAAHVSSGPLLAVASAVAVMGCPRVSVLGWAPLRGAGRLSYGWYLWHYPAIVLVGLQSGTLSRAAAAIAALLMAALSWRAVESPVLDPRRRADPRRMPPAESVADVDQRSTPVVQCRSRSWVGAPERILDGRRSYCGPARRDETSSTMSDVWPFERASLAVLNAPCRRLLFNVGSAVRKLR